MDGFPIGEVASVSCALLWSVATVLFRRSGERVPPVALNLFKNAVALVLFVATIPLLGVDWAPAGRSAEDWLLLLASGAIGIGIGDSLWFASLNRLGAGGSAIVAALYCPMVVFGAFLYLGESIGIAAVAATALMVGAILVGTWDPWTPRTPEERRRIAAGVALGIASMAAMATGIVAAKPVLDVSDSWWSSTVRLVGGTVFLLVQGAVPRHRADIARVFRPGRSWATAIPASVIGAYAAMLLWIVGMKYALASTASILNQTATIFTLVLGAIFLRERVTFRKVAGILMAFAGAVIAVS